MADKIKFWPIRGTYDQIMEQDYYDGKIYFAYDTNQIILDVNGSKHIMSGGGATGSGIVYADGTEEQIRKKSEDDSDTTYFISMDALDNAAVEPQRDALILNSDGRFFRVESVNSAEKIIVASLLAVSGSGSGGGGTKVSALTIIPDTSTITGSYSYISKQHFNVLFTITSTTEDDEANVTVEFFASSDLKQEPVATIKNIVPIGEQFAVDFGSVDYVGTGMYVRITAESAMAETPATRIFSNIRFIDMHLEKPVDPNNPNNYISITTAGDLQLKYAPYGLGLSRATLHVMIDNNEVESLSKTLSANDLNGTSSYVSIPEQSHGTHTIDLSLSAEIGGVELTSSFISYEAAWARSGEEVPIIWIGDVPETVIQYENAVIPYMIFDPKAGATDTEIIFYRNGVKVGEAEERYHDDGWLYWDVTSLYQLGENRFTIACGVSSKEVIINITDEGSRDLSLKNISSLALNFDAAGRSSREVKTTRGVWESTIKGTYTAQLNNFNWYNNGWQDNQDGFGSFLSVANGASVEIPFKTVTMNTGSVGHSFEIRFRVRNAKKYGTLVTEIPKYGWIDQDGKIIGIDYVDESGNKVEATGAPLTLDQIAARGGTLYRDGDGNPVMNEKDTTDKVVETKNNVAMKYLNENNEGFCIGTQEAYFRTSGKTVNVRYKENEIINISFVIDSIRKTLSIYLNGILSGAVNLSNVAAIDMVNIPFLINSEYCDFDLYKLRFYEIALTMPEVIHNYLSDLKSIALYDENLLTDKNDDTKLSYELLVQYNAEHPDAPTMPYAVIDMTKLSEADRELPHFKGGNKNVTIEFVNPTADYLLSLGPEKGGISEYEYYTHCPSFTADNVDLNVQGTSSQIYPRRNFKTKFKSAKKTWVYTQGSLAGKPIADGATLETGEKISKKWHMDSETLGTNKFTWKIDYMESSGSYNTGFANLMGNGIYDKHPLEDLNLRDLDSSVYRTSVYGFPMLVFHKTAENEYTYIGRYNMNLDKSSNEYYGFEEEIEHPYVDKTWYEYEDDGETIAATHEHPYIKDVAECWELRDNQGTWCSFRYPNEQMRAAGFGALTEDSDATNPKLEVSLHFEPRYNVEADQIEAAQKYKTTDDDGKSFVPQYIANESNAAICNYLRAKFANFERVFNWLDSTDGTSATNNTFDEPIRYIVSRESDDPTASYVYSINITTPVDLVDAPLSEDDPKNKKPTVVGTLPVGHYEVTENVTNQRGSWYQYAEGQWFDAGANSVILYGEFSADTVEYRKQKFYSEFNDHFDKHYCTIYFIMTELLLCYDSRGKNMMMATFGPHKKGGDYIWYPIFYDVDTQLGLNNVGAWLWDYNEDCTENRTFSTGTSVLWTNFYDLFKSEIISTYQALRRSKLTYQRIEGAYTCDPDVFRSSYAMRGKRPIIAIGLDEYYKYVLPTIQRWKHQDGTYSTADYLYACQGDRILSRELLINNRLLYMDSKWSGGDFTISTGGMAGIMFRVTANQQIATSDKYIDSSTPAAGQVVATYPVPYIDATPEFYVTPFLDFYVTTFVDEILYKTNESYDAAKYPNGIPTVISPSILESFKSGSVDQQLNYFAGSPYISSLGDLSTKYPNQIKYANAPHLLDITLGSDVPEYFNNETLDPFELHTERDEDTNEEKKPLLQKIILSNLRSLDRKIDATGAGKLQEFRALGTKLQGVTFADGAPLDIVHLPNTVESLKLVENKNLTRILREKPVILDMVDGKAVYRDKETYKGLYVEGLTDYDSSKAGTGSLINTIDFEGDALGYDSYEILQNLYNLKYGTGVGNRLKANLLNVKWTPYTQVEYGESQLTGIDYYYLTDHSTYEPYTNNNINDWLNNTLNGRIYTYDDSLNKDMITNLDLLDNFIADREAVTGNNVNQFINNAVGTISASVPAITGELYVNNDEDHKIDEDQLTSKYNKYWNKLKITARYINEAYLGKYVQVDMNTGKEVEIETFRYSPDAVTGQPVQDLPQKVISAPQTYDFRGWAFEYVNPTDLDVESKLAYNAETSSWTSLGLSKVFSAEQTVIKLYAVFTQTLYTIHYINPDGVEITTRKTTYGKPIPDPQELPVYDPGNLGLTEIYSFKGYTRNQADALPTNKNRLSSILLKLDATSVTEEDIRIYAVYMKQSVYDESTDVNCFDFTPTSYVEGVSEVVIPEAYWNSAYNVSNGYTINIKNGYKLTGKITLPSYYNGLPIITLGSTFNNSNSRGDSKEITHIFWKSSEAEPCKLRMLESSSTPASYTAMHLKYIELPEGLRVIGNRYFMSFESIETITPITDAPKENSIILPSTLARIGDSAFNSGFARTITLDLVKVPASVVKIGSLCFGNQLCSVEQFEIGSLTEGSNLYLVSSRNLLDNSGTVSGQVYNHSSGKTSNMTFYYKSQTQYEGFALIESYFSNIETKTYIAAN